MLKAISDLGYTPSQSGAIAATAKSDTLAVSAVQKSKLQASKKGKIEIKLKATAKGAVTVTAANESLGISATAEAKATKSKTIELNVEVPEGASAGNHELNVVVRVGEDEIMLKVPVTIE